MSSPNPSWPGLISTFLPFTTTVALTAGLSMNANRRRRAARQRGLSKVRGCVVAAAPELTESMLAIWAGLRSISRARKRSRSGVLTYTAAWVAAVWAAAVPTAGAAAMRGAGPWKRRHLARAAMSSALKPAGSMARPLVAGRTTTLPPTRASVASRGAVPTAGAIFCRAA